MYDIENIDTEAQSATAMICENAALFGATPERGEFDPREVWDRDEATAALSEAFRIIAEGIAPDGFQLADERESLLWGIVNAFDAQVRRLDRGVDRLSPELRDLQAAQDGSEVKHSLSFCPYRAARRGSLPLAQLPRALCSPCRVRTTRLRSARSSRRTTRQGCADPGLDAGSARLCRYGAG